MDWITSIPDLLSLLFGGSIISIVTWRFARQRAAAEALRAEAEAKQAQADARKAEAEALLEKQNYYQQMAEDIAKDRDYYKNDRDEQRKRQDEMEEQMRNLQRDVARNGRMVESLRPFICTDLKCKLRHRAVISDSGEIEDNKEQ